MIQKTARAKSARTRFVIMVHAIIHLQTFFRCYLAKKEMWSRRRLERLDPPTTDELEEDALTFLSPVSIDPLVTYRTFLDSGVSLARDVMEVVQQAERYAAKIERELMGIYAGHVDESSEDETTDEDEEWKALGKDLCSFCLKWAVEASSMPW